MSDFSASAKAQADALIAQAPAGGIATRGTRLFVVAALGVVLAVYVISQYAEILARIVQKLPHGHTAMAVLTAAAILPAAVAMPAVALLAELLMVGWAGSSLRKLLTGNRNSIRDGLYTVIGLLPFQFFFKSVLTLGVFYVADRHIAPLVSWNLTKWLPTWPLQYVGIVLAGSFFQYWQHRILHIVPPLWETHKLHHSATEMTVLNLNRESPFTTAVADLLILVPLAMIGSLELSARGGDLGVVDYFFMALFLCFSVFNVLNHYLIHSEIRSTYGWFGRWIFISPSAHRVHHSLLPQHWNKNFSVSLVIWDRLFGTWEPAASLEAANTPIGYPDSIYNSQSPLIDYFWLPCREFVRAIRRLVIPKSAA